MPTIADQTTGRKSDAPSSDASPDALAELLVAQGHCDARGVERARRIAVSSGQRFDVVLGQLGLVTERGLAEAFSELLGLRVVPPERYPEAPLLAEKLAARFLRSARALPLAIEDGALVLALADPLDAFTPAAIAAATGHRVAVEVAVPVELEAALGRLYPDGPGDAAEDGGGIAVSAEDGGEVGEPLEADAERLKDLASEAPVIRLVNQMIARAVETRTSDIHVEPFEGGLRVRYRRDGVLHEAEAPPPRLSAAITSRIKIMARLDIAERRLPQDGRIKLAVRGQDIDLRVSTVPSLHGETVVLRVLDRSAVAFDYERLGLPPEVARRFAAALDLPDGIVLVTGPVGSGKTTTLYTGLLGLNSVQRKIVTIEDPIEFQLRGITQIQVKPQIGLTFASLLRNIVRQDPNVVMVGEIRDLETAQTAVTAALAGRLVLSTLHTNSAATTIARLRDMGLDDYLLATVLRGVLAQRLVRRLCGECKREVEAPPKLVSRFGLDRRARGGPIRLWRPVGCPHCDGSGYRGRQAVAEFLVSTPDLERLIFSRADDAAIERAAVEGGMVTMLEAGIDAALAGTTTLEEVVRSIRADSV